MMIVAPICAADNVMSRHVEVGAARQSIPFADASGRQQAGRQAGRQAAAGDTCCPTLFLKGVWLSFESRGSCASCCCKAERFPNRCSREQAGKKACMLQQVTHATVPCSSRGLGSHQSPVAAAPAVAVRQSAPLAGAACGCVGAAAGPAPAHGSRLDSCTPAYHSVLAFAFLCLVCMLKSPTLIQLEQFCAVLILLMVYYWMFAHLNATKPMRVLTVSPLICDTTFDA